MKQKMTLPEQLEQMQRDWDQRARENARYFVDTSRTDWTDETFFASGERAVAEDILTDFPSLKAEDVQAAIAFAAASAEEDLPVPAVPHIR